MVRTVFLSLLAFMLFSCSSKPKTGYKDLKSVVLDSVGVVMQVPSSYREYSLEEEMYYWDHSGMPAEVVEKKIAYLLNLMHSTNSSQYLADSANIGNDVRILEYPLPIKIGAYTSRESFLAIDEMIQEQSDFLGIKYEALENNYFIQSNGNEVMKIRYRATEHRITTASLSPFSFDDPYVYYMTFYMVVGQSTVMVVVNHEFEDFEYFIRTIRFH